jgi:hypothetical protein
LICQDANKFLSINKLNFMPIEIRELLIKPTVADPTAAVVEPIGNGSMSAEEKEALIQEVVARVLEQLAVIKTKSATLPDSFR